MKMDYSKIKERVGKYKGILKNTQNYRKDWSESLKTVSYTHLTLPTILLV